MTKAHFHWFNALETDNRDRIAGPVPNRIVTPEYRADAARAAERNGFESLLCMVGMGAPDPWILASSLIPSTSTIKFIVAVRPGNALPTTVAEQAATFQAVSGNRLHLNIVTGSNEAELRAHGDLLNKQQRYDRTGEFFDVLEGTWRGPGFSYEGEYYRVENGGLPAPLAVKPQLFIGGSSDEGIKLASRYSAVHLSYGEPPPLLKETVDRVKELADREGRRIQFGIRIGVIARPTSEEAWREADRILANIDPAEIRARRPYIEQRTSVAQARVQKFNPGHKNDPDALKIYPTMWAGTGLVGGGGGSTALVGSYAEVAERIEEYLSIGVEHFIVSGRPLLESSYEIGENILPYFRESTRQAVA